MGTSPLRGLDSQVPRLSWFRQRILQAEHHFVVGKCSNPARGTTSDDKMTGTLVVPPTHYATETPNTRPSTYVTAAAPKPIASCRRARFRGEVPPSTPTIAPVAMFSVVVATTPVTKALGDNTRAWLLFTGAVVTIILAGQVVTLVVVRQPSVLAAVVFAAL